MISLVEVAKRTSRLEEQIKTQAEQIELLKTQLEDLKAKSFVRPYNRKPKDESKGTQS